MPPNMQETSVRQSTSRLHPSRLETTSTTSAAGHREKAKDGRTIALGERTVRVSRSPLAPRAVLAEKPEKQTTAERSGSLKNSQRGIQEETGEAEKMMRSPAGLTSKKDSENTSTSFVTSSSPPSSQATTALRTDDNDVEIQVTRGEVAQKKKSSSTTSSSSTDMVGATDVQKMSFDSSANKDATRGGSAERKASMDVMSVVRERDVQKRSSSTEVMSVKADTQKMTGSPSSSASSVSSMKNAARPSEETIDEVMGRLASITLGKKEADQQLNSGEIEAARKKREAVQRAMALLKQTPSSSASPQSPKAVDDDDGDVSGLTSRLASASLREDTLRSASPAVDISDLTTKLESASLKEDTSPPRVGIWRSAKALRDYQQRLVSAAISRFGSGAPSLLLYLPTGGGKTAIAVKIIEALQRSAKAESDFKTAVFVHRDELAWQMERSLVEWGCPQEAIGFIKSKQAFDVHKSIQIVSIQSFAKRFIRSSDGAALPHFDLILIDEAHHAMADEYMALVNLYPDTKLLGVTATPFRLNKGELLGDIFFDRVIGPSIDDLTRLSWLVPAVFIRSSSSRGTLTREGARNPKFLEAAVVSWKHRWSERKTIVFCIDVAHAKALCDVFASHGVEAAVITGQMRREERERVFYRSRSGEISVLCSVDVVSEGVDTVWIDCLILFRPTESRGLFVQQLGRGLRPFQNKQDCIVIDEVGNIFRHGFAFKYITEEDTATRSEQVRIYDCPRHHKCRGLVEKKDSKCSLCHPPSSKRVVAADVNDALSLKAVSRGVSIMEEN